MVSDDNDDIDSILEGLDDESIVQVKDPTKQGPLVVEEDLDSLEETIKESAEEIAQKEKAQPQLTPKKPSLLDTAKEKKDVIIASFISFFTLNNQHASKAKYATIYAMYALIMSIMLIIISLIVLSYKSPHKLLTEEISLQSTIAEIEALPAPVVLTKNKPITEQDNIPAAEIKYSTDNALHGDTAPYDYYKSKISSHEHIKKPKIAIIVTDIGLNKNRLQDVFTQSPTNTTLAFSSYAEIVTLDKNAEKSFENWLVLPTEKTNEAYDPGIIGLFNSRDIKLNLSNLNSLLNRQNSYTGFIIPPYSAFPKEKQQYKQLVERIYELGYGIADASNAAIDPQVLTSGLPDYPYFQVDLVIDNELTPRAINSAFRKLEIIAEENKKAIGLIHSYPISLELYNLWADTLDERGFVLLPLSALFNKDGIKKHHQMETTNHVNNEDKPSVSDLKKDISVTNTLNSNKDH
jgi:polysaccharide deacetylase 2 family uncharacterized protein YibQ